MHASCNRYWFPIRCSRSQDSPSRSAYRPAQEVGGDFFQIIPLDGGSTLVVLGDVSGKGLKAAMAVSLIVGAIRTLAEATSSPAEILAGLNRRLYGRLQGGFATCMAMRSDPDGLCTIASAGHPAPFLNDEELNCRARFRWDFTTTASYRGKHRYLCEPGDHFALYTDGLLEARSRRANSTASSASKPSSPPGPMRHKPLKPRRLRPGRRHYRAHLHPPGNRRTCPAAPADWLPAYKRNPPRRNDRPLGVRRETCVSSCSVIWLTYSHGSFPCTVRLARSVFQSHRH